MQFYLSMLQNQELDPTYQKTNETVKYVDTANTSHKSGDVKLTHKPCWFGYGNK